MSFRVDGFGAGPTRGGPQVGDAAVALGVRLAVLGVRRVPEDPMITMPVPAPTSVAVRADVVRPGDHRLEPPSRMGLGPALIESGGRFARPRPVTVGVWISSSVSGQGGHCERVPRRRRYPCDLALRVRGQSGS